MKGDNFMDQPNLISKIKGHRGLYEYIKIKKNNNID